MKLESTYLSDEELERLIADVEQNELVAAPPDLMEGILSGIETTTILEFRRYCFRVLTSVAAAVAILFLLPGLGKVQFLDMPAGQQIMVWETARPEIKTPAQYATKEEVLDDRGIFTGVFGGTNIFDNDDKLNLFNGRNGE